MPNQKLQPRLLLLLLPLALLTLISYAFDLRIRNQFSIALQSDILFLSRLFIPSLFALGAALLIPTSSRILQLIAVISNYFLLAFFSLQNMPGLFSQPTAWVIASLSSTLVLLPDLDRNVSRKKRSSLIILGELLLTFILPQITLIIIVIIIESLGNFISSAFTTNLVTSPFSCIIVPIYSLMQALGFNSLLNSIVNLQYNNEYTDALLNSISLGNILVLPIILLTSSFISPHNLRPFLCFFTLVVPLTSHIGTCVSIELTIILLFLQGCFFAFILSSISVFFISLYYDLPALTNFHLLYLPDLSFKHLSWITFAHNYYEALIVITISTLFIQIFLVHLYKFRYIRNTQRLPNLKNKIKLNRHSSPDLYVIALLKAFGGLSNLRSIIRQGRICYIKANDPNIVSLTELNRICMHKPRFERNHNVYVLDIGDNCAIITENLSAMIADIGESSDTHITLSQEYIIR